MLFHDASGTPLYAPYPLAIAVPAMMIGHLAIAGIAELVITGGLVAYLQRSNPDLLTVSAFSTSTTSAWKSTRALWYWLASLMIASPIGLLAAGTAWGVEDFASAELRQEILQVSGGIAPPEAVPSGLERLASVWTAPIPDYVPGFLQNVDAGYVVSAAIGVGLILLLFLLIAKSAGRNESPEF